MDFLSKKTKVNIGRAIIMIENMQVMTKLTIITVEEMSIFLNESKQLIVNCKYPSIKNLKIELYKSVSSSN